MDKVFFLIDGNYLYNQFRFFETSLWVRGDTLIEYCSRHLGRNESLFRVYYYDSPPWQGQAVNPLGNELNFSGTAAKIRATHDSIRSTHHIFFREGKVAWHNDWILSSNILEQLVRGRKSIKDLSDEDFRPNFKQKAVDMAFGIDIASIACKGLAQRVVLVAGDSDFVPAAQLARNEGLVVTLDPAGGRISNDLAESVDWVENVIRPEEIGANKDKFWRGSREYRP